MKTTEVLKSISFLLILIIAVSCRSSRSTSGRQYPRGSTYPTETPTQTYPVYADAGNLPPGQAKKVYGSQSAKPYAPGQRKKISNRYPLILVYRPGIVISQHSDGRYYYRNTAGYTYWKGYDGRYYIDEKHLNEIEYEGSEHNDWKNKGQKNNNAQQPKQREEEKVKEKTKEAEPIAKDKEQKEKGQPQNAKGNDQKEKGQPQNAKGNDQKEKGQPQIAKGNDQKGKGDQDSKGNNGQKEKQKDRDEQKAKDDNSQKEKGNEKKKA